MTPRQNRRAHADLRHRNRKQRLRILLAAKPKSSNIVDASEATQPALVVGIGPGLCLASIGGEVRNVRCDLPVAPGDLVYIRHEKVAAVAPRRTLLTRTDPSNPRRELLIAANIDLLVIVAAAADPPFRPGLVDRYLIAAARAGITPILCLNKIDLNPHLNSAPGVSDLCPVPTVRCSAATGRGIDELAALLAGNLSVFAGHSGVGKSTLLNALSGEDTARIGDVSDHHGRGRHTTTSSRLYELSNGARIIDTPGIREFGLGRMTRGELRAAFPEFDAQGCRFRDCSHREEPGCAVRDAGHPRYAQYLRLAAEL